MSNDNLGDRMKALYEDPYRITLPGRMPVIIRVDMKAGSSYTKKLNKPFDSRYEECMNDAALALCKEIQGAQLAYIQSDEVSVLINNYKSVNSQSWFGNNINKMVSISAATASVTFTNNSYKIWGWHDNTVGSGFEGTGYDSPIIKPAYFDSRAFILPKEEVVNYFLWRQTDASRNSVSMLAQSLYSHKQLLNKNSSELQELCWQNGKNWNDCTTSQKRGRCIIKSKTMKEGKNPQTGQIEMCERSEWIVDNEIPIFSQDRNYIDQYVYPVVAEK